MNRSATRTGHHGVPPLRKGGTWLPFGCVSPAYGFVFASILVHLLVPAALAGQEPPGSGDPQPFAYAAYTGMVIRGITVEIQECPWCRETVRNLAVDLVSLKEGEAFTEERFRLTMEALQLSRRFEQITPIFERFEGGIVLTLAVKPSRIVKDIRISGEYPLFRSDVLKAMSVYVGDSLLPDTLAQQEELIRSLYRKEGYANPKVTVKEGDVLNGTVVIDVDIRPGDYYTLESVKISGNDAVTDAEILSRMSSWRQSFFIFASGRFLEADLAQDIKDIRDLYWQRGYPECEITYTVDRDEKDLAVSTAVTIVEGPLYDLSIKGNDHFWAYTLKQDVVMFEEGNRRDRGLRRSTQNMVDRYRAEGFLDVEVEALEEKETVRDRKRRTLELVVTEGPRTLVEAVVFTGATAISEERLRDAMQTGNPSFFKDPVYDPDVLAEDIAALKGLFLARGYTAVEITPEVAFTTDRTGATVTVQVAEGVRTVVTSLAIEGLASVGERKALAALGLRQGRPYREGLVRSDETVLSDLVSGTGHPYVKVRGETVFNADRTEAAVVYHVDEGPFVTMGNIYYSGNFRTRTSVIRRELEIDPGEPFSLKTMLEGQKRIRDMQAFESVQFKTMGIREQQDRVTLLIDMEEVKPYYYEAGFGYVTDRGLYGRAKAGDRNLFGLNKHAWLGGEVSQIGYRGDLSVTQQRIFDAPVLNTYTLSYERKEEFNQIFGTSVWTSALSFLWRYEPRITTSLGFRYELRDQFLQDSSYTIPEGDEDSYRPRSVLVTTPSVSYDSRDSFVRPKKGIYSSYSVDISKGYQSSLDNFLKHYVNLRFYYSPTRRVTFAWLGRFGYIDPFGDVSRIPEDQLFYLGGTMSVRGFDENTLRFDAGGDPVGGRMAIAGSMEARVELTRDWETALFYDTGTVRRTLVNAGSEDVRSSAGIGMRYLTPIGPIGVLYGRKIDRKDGESAGRFHISVGYTF